MFVVVCWLLNVPATCECISGTDLLSFTCCHTEIEVADPTLHLTQSQYTDTGPTSPSTNPITPGAWQDSHWSAKFEVTGMTRPRKILAQAGFEPVMVISLYNNSSDTAKRFLPALEKKRRDKKSNLFLLSFFRGDRCHHSVLISVLA